MKDNLKIAMIFREIFRRKFKFKVIFRKFLFLHFFGEFKF